MWLNRIWVFFFLAAFVAAVFQCIFGANFEVFNEMMNSTFSSARTGFEISLGLTGVLAFWLGILKIGERSGLISGLSRLTAPFFSRIFPSIPPGHPAMGNIFMNISANMLGLDNAATPIGLQAMREMQTLNDKPHTATDAMIMFLVLNTSGLTLIPVSIMVYRAQMGAANPADVFLPILLTTYVSTLVGFLAVAIRQRLRLLDPVIVSVIGGLTLLVGGLLWGFSRLPEAWLVPASTFVAGFLLISIITFFVGLGAYRRINVYDAFIEGAKEGFSVAVNIIPYLIAILVAIALFRASGAMDWLMLGLTWCISRLGADTRWVDALPTALMKPLSGSGARGLMVDAMQQHGADSFVGRLVCILQGATDTTFYILSVYFGSVGVSRFRYALTCGLLADLAGIIAAFFIGYLFFG